jgi:cyclohexa-1,5-dienecarbonyl-CoA hydratase
VSETATSTDVVRVVELDDGAIWHAVLATPKANIIDSPKVRALHALFERAGRTPALKAIVLEGEGAHFSYGASVEEHLPANCAAMLASLHGMLRALLASHVPCLAAVRGQCLGAGLELVALCHRIFAAPDARLGQPEIALGVFAPVGSLALAERLGRGAAEDLLLGGRSLAAEEARTLGLVDQVNEDPRVAAFEYARKHLLPKSAASLRFAVRAARLELEERLGRELPRLEQLYLQELMQSADALEGLEAFLAKRPPRWRNA